MLWSIYLNYVHSFSYRHMQILKNAINTCLEALQRGRTDDRLERMVKTILENQFWEECDMCFKKFPNRNQVCHECHNRLTPIRSQEEVEERSHKMRKTVTPQKLGSEQSSSSRVHESAGIKGCGLYDHIPSNHQPVKITPRDPIFTNPSSYES